MTDLFLKVFNMSIAAVWMVLAVLVVRLLLKKAPKWICVLLWGFVAIRLICPFSFQSVLSLIPSTETVSPEIMMDRQPTVQTGIPALNEAINPVISQSFAPKPWASANPLQILIPVMSVIWVAGTVLMLGYALGSYLCLRMRMKEAVRYQDGIYMSERVISPFVLGLWKPRIYLPYHMDGQTLEYVIAHEKAHISRRDHWWKPVGFVLLAVHWFNPILWVAYILLCRDIELACDEKVIRALEQEQRADYSQALLLCSVRRSRIAACPLAFGEVGVKERVKTVLHYKKPAFWVAVAAAVACVAIAVCFLTDPIRQEDSTARNIIAQEGYTVIGQSRRQITLSVPAASLPADIYSEEGWEFEPGQIVAYQDETAKIYLKSARYANEGNDKLYFCFDFLFDLPRDGGKMLYPYAALDKGYTYGADVVDKTIRAGQTHYENSVLTRGQGDGEKIWYYISTQVLRQVEGTLEFDIYLNEITYLKDGADYGAVFGFAGDEVPEDTGAAPDGEALQELKKRYPGYFGLDASQGLRVYIYQMAKDSYSCVLRSGKEKVESWQTVSKMPAAGLHEMRQIVQSYGVARDQVWLIPMQMPYSSYMYTIDDTYRAKLWGSFWSAYTDVPQNTQFSPVIDSIAWDIDGDGNAEMCSMRYGPTSGLFSVTLLASPAEPTASGQEFEDTFVLKGSYELSFVVSPDQKLKIRGEDTNDPERTVWFDMGVKDGHIVLQCEEEDLYFSMYQ